MLFVALHIPSRIYELFPVAALIGTLFAIAQLVANSEYTVMRASGASIVQVGWAVVRVGIPLALATFLAGEFVAPPAERLAQTVRAAAMGNATGVVAQQFESGFWFKQDLTFVNIRTVLADMTLVGVRIYEFDRDLRLTAVRSAETGRFAGQGVWNLEQVKSPEIGRDGTVVVAGRMHGVGDGAAAVDADRLPGGAGAARANHAVRQHPGAGQPEDVALRDRVLDQGVLSGRRDGDDDAGAAVRAFPAPRQGGVGFRIFAGTMLGLAFFLIGRLFSNLGVLNDWPPLFSAVFPLACSPSAIAMQW